MAVKQGRRLLLGTLGVWLGLLGGTPRASAQGVDVEGFKSRVFQLLNEQRSANGLPALRRVAPLESAAQSHSEAMMRATGGGPVFLSHTGPDGSSVADRVNQAGYAWFSLGENIAAGQRSPDEVVRGWMNSPGHRANILNGAFRDVGIGLATGPGTWPGGYQDAQVLWWTTNFGNSRSSYPSAGDGTGAGTTAPVVTGYTATMGIPIFSAPPGAPVVIVGSNLGSSGVIRFGSVTAPTPINWSPTSITVIVPAAPSYPYRAPVTVEVNGQTAAGPEFLITPPPAPAPPVPTPSPPTSEPAPVPVVTGYAATQPRGVRIFSAPPGAPLLIVGSNFGASGSVSFNGLPAARVLEWSPTEILALVPTAPSYPFQGPVTVEVNGHRAAGPAFTITPPPVPPAPEPPAPTPQPPAPEPPAAAPVVAGYAATQPRGVRIFSAPPGAPLLIVGSNLGRTGRVFFNGVPAPSAANWTPTEILVSVPSAPNYPFRGVVQVEVDGRRASGPEFTITPPPAPTPPPGSDAPTSGTTSPNPSPPAPFPVTPSPPPAASVTGPKITALVNGLQQPITTVQAGSLFLIRGRGFGSNEARQGRVLFLAGGVPRAVDPLHWSDETISVFAPWFPGRADVAVRVENNGALVTSNWLPLEVR